MRSTEILDGIRVRSRLSRAVLPRVRDCTTDLGKSGKTKTISL